MQALATKQYLNYRDYQNDAEWRSHEDTRSLEVESRYSCGQTYSLRGTCILCGNNSNFSLNDQFSWIAPDGCQKCLLVNRMRAMVHVCLGNLRLQDGGRVYLTEQSTMFHEVLRPQIPKGNLIGSEFLRDGTLPGMNNQAGLRHEDATHLSFADNSLYCVATFDVLEHIPDYRQALVEFYRCLAPGGVLLLTAPFVPHYEHTRTLARVLTNGEIEHLEAPEYHGDPLSDQGILCFYHFGWSLLGDLKAVGFSAPAVHFYWSEEFGYLGGSQPFILARKSTT